MKNKSKTNKENNTLLISIKSNSSFFKQKEKDERKNFTHEKINNSLKSRTTQSFSTGTEDKKDDEIKEFFSMKNLNSFDIIKNYNVINIDNTYNKSLYILKLKELNSINSNDKTNKFENNQISNDLKNENICNINLLNIHVNLKNNINDLNKSSPEKGEYTKKNICFNEYKIISPNNIKIEGSSSKNDKIYIEKKIIKNGSNKIQKDILKPFPPKTPTLLENIYIFSENNKNKTINHDCYVKLNRSKIPNNFYNHFFVQNCIKKKENSKYVFCSTTNRIRGKLLTILYFCPIKK